MSWIRLATWHKVNPDHPTATICGVSLGPAYMSGSRLARLDDKPQAFVCQDCEALELDMEVEDIAAERLRNDG